MNRGAQWLAAGLLVAGAGCAARGPAAWRIEGHTLAPPGKPGPVALRSRGACPSGGAIGARRKGGRTLLAVDAGALERQPAGWLADWAWRAEEAGCVPPGEWPALARRVLDSAPLALGLRYRLMHPDHARSGFIDLGSAGRLEVVSPILRAGAGPGAAEVREKSVEASTGGLTVTLETSPDLLGVETAWYAASGDAFLPVRVEARIRGVPETRAAPARDLLAGVRGRFWRLVYKADQTEVLLAADSRRAIEEATTSSECPAGVRCIAVPRSVAVNPYLAVSANGREVTVTMGATLGRVIRTAGGDPLKALATLAVSKPFAGRLTAVEFDRSRPDVLDLVMEGDEVVRW